MSGSPAPAPRVPGGITLGRVAGIPIVIMPSWFVIALLGIVVVAPEVHNLVPSVSNAVDYAIAGLTVVLLYASVLAHELSHALVARALGLPVRRILLQLLGGLSEITREPATPSAEFMVAVSGPMTSLLLTAVAFAIRAHLMHHTLAWGIVDLFAGLNLLVAVFNLLPGLPLDGGRVLRAGLWWGLRDKVSATKGAAYAGRGLAGLVVLGTLSFVRFTGTNNTLTIFYGVLVAWFIWQSANQALVQVKIGAVLPSLGARGLTRRALRVSAELPLAEAVRRANETGSRALVVVDGRGEPDGIVPEAAVLAVPMERRPWVSVGSLARRIDASLRLSVDLTGQDLLTAMQQAPATEYLVVEQTGQVYGVLSQADVLAALRAAR